MQPSTTTDYGIRNFPQFGECELYYRTAHPPKGEFWTYAAKLSSQALLIGMAYDVGRAWKRYSEPPERIEVDSFVELIPLPLGTGEKIHLYALVTKDEQDRDLIIALARAIYYLIDDDEAEFWLKMLDYGLDEASDAKVSLFSQYLLNKEC